MTKGKGAGEEQLGNDLDCQVHSPALDQGDKNVFTKKGKQQDKLKAGVGGWGVVVGEKKGRSEFSFLL